MRVGLDIDGVLCDVLTPWLNRCNAAQRETYKGATGPMPHMDWMPDDITEFTFWNQIGMPEADVWALFTPDIYEEAQPYAGVKKVVDAIIELGHSVVYVTSCRTTAEFDAKIKWLQRHELWKQSNGSYGVGELFFNKSKATVPVDWLVDDHVFNLETFPGYGLLLTRPWNRQQVYTKKRIRSLTELVTLLTYQKPVVAQADGDEGEEQKFGSSPIPIGRLAEVGETMTYDSAGVRQFATGATRDTDTGKYDYEAFLSPMVVERYAEFMHKNRFQKDGAIRDGDNWQRGIPPDAYIKSGFRHFMEWWMLHRKGAPLTPTGEDFLEEALCALMFNVQGYLFEHLKAKRGPAKQSAA